MDGPSIHKVEGVAEALAERGATALYLPPYSPDLNPIENAFAKLKALLRKAAARSIDQLRDAIARIIQTYSPHECANYFAAAGYDAD
jgi:transposase